MRNLIRGLSIFRSYSQMALLKNKAFVNGDWVASGSQQCFNVYNPSDQTVVSEVPNLNVRDVEAVISAAHCAFQSWKATTNKERSQLLRKWFYLLERNKDELATILTAESGKPLLEAAGEVTYGNSFIEWFSEEARRIQGEIIASPVPQKKLMAIKQPIGVVSLITPWNFPHAMIARKAGAALAAGCTCVVKPSEETPLTALAMAHLAEEAGIPKGVFNVITCNNENSINVGKLLCESPLIAGVSFTGSTQVGKILYKLCSSGVKRISMELGGNAPFIVFNSAKIDNAIKGAMVSKFRNCGQTCVASNRFLVQSGIYDPFVAEFANEMKELKLGCGMKSGVQCGPLINEKQFNQMKLLVEDALSKGAKAVVGGKPATELGKLFFEPTLLIHVNETMMVYHQESFGPIAPIIPFDTEEEALRIANCTESGLASYFYTEDLNQIFRVSQALECGMVGINEGMISTAEAPFGGVKLSGIGREGSTHGIDDFTFIKYLCIGNVM